MKRETHSGTPLARRFQRFLSHLVLHTRDDLRHLPLQTDRRIHALRTRMKKLGAILRLVKSRMKEEEYRAILASAKKLKNAFTRQRDARVSGHLSAQLQDSPLSEAGPPLRPMAPQFIEAAILGRLLTESAFKGLRDEDVLQAYVTSYRKGRKRWKACVENSRPDLLHAWRKAVKKLFYQSLALRHLKGAKHRIERARKLGKWLGRDHDWHLLAERAAHRHHPGNAQLIEEKRARGQKRIFKLAEQLFLKPPHKLRRKLERHLKG